MGICPNCGSWIDEGDICNCCGGTDTTVVLLTKETMLWLLKRLMKLLILPVKMLILPMHSMKAVVYNRYGVRDLAMKFYDLALEYYPENEVYKQNKINFYKAVDYKYGYSH